MIKVLLYKKEGCHLCDEAEAILEELKEKQNFLLERVMLEQNSDMFEKYGNRVPIVFINGEMVFEFKLDKQTFLRKLAELG